MWRGLERDLFDLVYLYEKLEHNDLYAPVRYERCCQSTC